MKRDSIKQGLVCVLSATESCQSFRIASGKGRPVLKNARRKCLCLYFYFLDPVYGLLHVRVQSWMPLNIQVCMNGHEWLERQLLAEGLDYAKQDNRFSFIADMARAQTVADGFQQLDWRSVLNELAARANPLLETLFKGEQINLCKKRFPGARVKHWMKGNWIKMYKYLDALSCVDDPGPSRKELTELSEPVVRNQQRLSGFNPVQRSTTALFKEVLNGDYIVQGFRNADIRTVLFGRTDAPRERRMSARISRLFKKLHARGLIAKIPRSRCWRVTQKGWRVLGPLVEAYA